MRVVFTTLNFLIMIPFVDIHTHRLCVDNEVVAVVNVMPFQEIPPGPVQFSAGVHPWYVERGSSGQYDKWLGKASGSKRCLMIGEAGLDNRCNIPLDDQMACFRRQVELSIKIGKPLIIHCVGMYNEIFTLSREYGNHPCWIFHGFNSSARMVSQFISQNVAFSFGSIILRNEKSIRLLNEVPIGRLLFETDESDAAIKEIYNCASLNLNIEMDVLKYHIYNNFKNILNGGRLA